MYLVFDLPPMEGNDPSPHTVAFWVHRELDSWEQKYNIPYKTKFHKLRLRLIFSNDSDYHFFLLSWNPNRYIAGMLLEEKWIKPRVVETPKH